MTQPKLAQQRGSNLSAADYHADPCETPSLSASMIHILVSQSPAHAWTAHPKLNPDYEPDEQAKYDIGKVAHALLLEGEAAVVCVDAKDWRTKLAQEQRDQIRELGKSPLLTQDFAEVEAMVAAARVQLASHGATPEPFTDGKPEQTLAWTDSGVECRARLDWLHDDGSAIDDYKTTSKSANPESWSRTLFGIGSDIQAALYRRGLLALTGAVAEFRWVVQETTPPYALAVIAPGPDVLTIADKKIEWALETWRRCLETNHWPGYPSEVCYAQLPAWEEARWLAREEDAA